MTYLQIRICQEYSQVGLNFLVHIKSVPKETQCRRPWLFLVYHEFTVHAFIISMFRQKAIDIRWRWTKITHMRLFGVQDPEAKAAGTLAMNLPYHNVPL